MSRASWRQGCTQPVERERIFDILARQAAAIGWRPAPPFTIANVTLPGWPTMMTCLVGFEPDAVAIGDAVEIVFCASGGWVPVPCWPASADHDAESRVARTTSKGDCTMTSLAELW
ncbi:MAG: OB-fold domain-containing protein, partial [Acetobacteraceae bacterium]